MDNTYKRKKEALEKAEDAFWASIVESYPEIKTGDFHPCDHRAFAQASENALDAWLYWNRPEPKNH
jgi:hypothetical protein